jgi:hypothetical protein
MADSRYPSDKGSTASLETAMFPKLEMRKDDLILIYNSALFMRVALFILFDLQLFNHFISSSEANIIVKFNERRAN